MSESAAALNARTDASLTSRAAESAKVTPASVASKRATAKKVVKPAAKRPVVKAANARKALTPKERAARPVTATIAAYVEWLDKNRILSPKPLTAEQKRVAGISITLYGAYQISPERRTARVGR